tara:strand:+ start:144 stop:653 length:510 start_codon:yes stop_codon:yes gene_type:complete
MRLCILGFMGAGKSSLGKLISSRLKLPFIDLDDYIEAKESLSISEIFKQKGQTAFREIENNCLREVLDLETAIISLGGGTPCTTDNISLIKEKSLSLFIDLPVNMLFNRLKNARRPRPLIQDLNEKELKTFIENKMLERRPYYSQANKHVHASKDAIDEVLNWLSTNKH